jgi:hypothetical protein
MRVFSHSIPDFHVGMVLPNFSGDKALGITPLMLRVAAAEVIE